MAAAREMRDRGVVVTGAAGGLGAAFADCYAALGAKLALLDLDAARAEALAARLRAQGANAHAFGCDITDEGACSAAIAQARRALGGIDLLVNNAGISARLLLADATPEIARRVMAVNYFGALHATHAALPSLLARRGQIVVVSSVAGFAPLVGRTAYAASKHALHGFFDSLRAELRGTGVTVTIACPSFIATGIEQAAPGAARRATGGDVSTPQAIAARIVDAARRDRRLCLPGRTARLAWWLSRVAPAVYEGMMLRRVGGEFGLGNESKRR
ncbi:MAG TPA: SDR family oxidoreductase [Burkholderiaceae bacterium]|nr:SDR family oxidoreductase [Burkholderiaceae bacterium]